jgi:hypothetical protein
MIETNLRLVEPGPELQLKVRYARVQASDDSPDLLWRACGALMGHGLAAVPSGRSELAIATDQPIPSVDLHDEDWHLEVRDSGRVVQVGLMDSGDVRLLEKLIERLLLVQIQRRTHLWRMNDSASIWYESRPFMVKDDIAAYRRYEISGVALGDAGIGIAVDMGTAFFTKWTVAEFFREDLSRQEQERRRGRFETMSARQRGQKGTLLYNAAYSSHKCYFDRVPAGMTCATTGELTIRGRRFESLLHYYGQQSGMKVGADDPVAYVSFPGIGRSRPVSATRLRLRVMNDSLPRSLKQVDKIPPDKRSASIEKFWERIGGRPLGRGKPMVQQNFWRPPEEKLLLANPPSLTFGKGKILEPPTNGNPRERRDHFRERGHLLERWGCSEVPPAVARTIHFAVPQKIGDATATRLADDVVGRLSKWTGKRMGWELVLYEDHEDAIARLRAEPQSGLVVFVLDDAPEAYYEVSYELKPWRVKRIKSDTLVGKYTRLQLDERDATSGNGSSRPERGWTSFVEMSALDVLQQLDCVPYALAKEPNYEAQLAIDVGQDRRYYSLSLLVCRSDGRRPPFYLQTIVKKKPDPQHETMNKKVLRDEIVELLEQLGDSVRDPLRSVLVLRDGRQYGKELEGITEAREVLVRSGVLEEAVRVDVIDFHKSSARRIRLWDREGAGGVRHASEGTALLLDGRRAVLTNTGAATLNQGTAEPVMVVTHGNDVDLRAVVEDVHATTHLNWSSPSVAQRLPLVLKRTDEQLRERAAQEVRRVR